MPRVIIVSNRLPVSVTRIPSAPGSSQDSAPEFQLKQSVGGLATGLASLKGYDRLWIGWPGEVFTDPLEQEIIRDLLKEKGLVPVFLDKQDLKMFYAGFSNQTLWPHFHYFTQFTNYTNESFKWYQSVNEKFRDAVLENVNTADSANDMVWVHDYQLLLLPAMIRNCFQNVGIGFFLHIPFPSYEIFRTLPWRRALLLGMLGADCIGFHTIGYLRHFLSAVGRICAFEYVPNRLQVGNRVVSVGAYPMGIDYNTYSAKDENAESTPGEPQSNMDFSILKEKGTKIIISVDRLDYTKGIPSRIRAYKRFLEENPNYLSKVTMVQIIVPSRGAVDEYKDLRDEIETLISKVSGEYDTFQWSAIHYFCKPFPTEKLIPMYRHADVCLVTPLRDGMNLVAKEYVAAKDGMDTGVLILSEMAGSADELVDSLIVNPNDETDIIEAIKMALEMPVLDQKHRLRSLQKTVKTYTVQVWANVFIKSLLEAIATNQQNLNAQLSHEPALGAMLARYANSRNRLLLLDYDGTLMQFARNPDSVKPDQELITLLKQLCESSKSQVVVISGRDRLTLESWLGQQPNLDFASEHGVWLRRQNQWKCALTNEDLARIELWKHECNSTLAEMRSSVPGTLVEQKHSSIAWHYRGVETNVAQAAIKKFAPKLREIAAKYELQILEGNMVFEVKTSKVNKGIAANQWLTHRRFPGSKPETRSSSAPKPSDWDFIIAIGDDNTDEDTFQAVNAADPDAYTVKVGGVGVDGNTAARFTLSNVAKVRNVLNELVRVDRNQRSP